MIEVKCISCIFYNKANDGCHRYPPIPTALGSQVPVVDKDYWCGEFKENKDAL